ncbi:MAG: DUF1295 domain-containing protein [Deltaproteobacteria bacterium]|nr:DUF1295 domain-containing protein [Deltaproteobacteria bacterium]
MSAETILQAGALSILALGLAAVIALTFLSAPYGRHARAGWGPSIGARRGWHLMEAPAFFGFVGVALYHLVGPGLRAPVDPASWILFALWILHYGDRDLLYPRRLRDPYRPMPLAVVGMGFSFNLLNGPPNGLAVGLERHPVAWLLDPRFLGGVLLFLAGFGLNRASDARLLRLREANPGGYAIPRGGLFTWVSCPNYLAEIVQWIGWALATGSLIGAAFAIFTACNLAPRALQHHRWYRENFPDYPPGRRALLPFVL